jgi:hypothetical protein
MNPQNNNFGMYAHHKVYWIGLDGQLTEVSNQQEVIDKVPEWKIGDVHSLLCSVEKFERCTIVEMGPTATRKELALVTFPESGEKKRKSFKERLAEEMANQKGEKQSQEETRFNGFVVTIDDGFVCYEYRFPGGDHLSIQALAEAISSETGLEIESFQQVKTLNP